MQLLLPLVLMLFSAVSSLFFDLAEDKDAENWAVINDGVMGGKSRGKIQSLPKSLLFEGVISLENNGGFSSLKRRFEEMDLSGQRTVEIKYKSTGLKTAFTLETSKYFYVPNFKMPLANTGGEWKTVFLTLEDFKQYRLGRETGKSLREQQLSEIIRLGFICSAKEEGPFVLEVEYLKFY